MKGFQLTLTPLQGLVTKSSVQLNLKTLDYMNVPTMKDLEIGDQFS